LVASTLPVTEYGSSAAQAGAAGLTTSNSSSKPAATRPPTRSASISGKVLASSLQTGLDPVSSRRRGPTLAHNAVFAATPSTAGSGTDRAAGCGRPLLRG